MEAITCVLRFVRLFLTNCVFMGQELFQHFHNGIYSAMNDEHFKENYILRLRSTNNDRTTFS